GGGPGHASELEFGGQRGAEGKARQGLWRERGGYGGGRGGTGRGGAQSRLCGRESRLRCLRLRVSGPGEVHCLRRPFSVRGAGDVCRNSALALGEASAPEAQ